MTNRPNDISHFLCRYEDLTQRLMQIDPVSYGKTRNFLNGDVTWLSPFITHGIITTRDVAEAVFKHNKSKDCYRLMYELAWREYFHRVWQRCGDDIFTDMRTPSPSNRRQIPTAILNAKTGIHAIDKEIRNLITHGFMHNHARMWTAALCCNMGDTHWLSAAKWMHYHLLDGDLASNTLSWQWVAGTFSDKRYIANQDNVNKYSQSNQQGTFLDVSYEKLATFQRPAELADTTDASMPQVIPGVPVTEMPTLSGTVAVRSIWQLNAQWRMDADHQVLFIESALHNQWPMSRHRWQFVLHWADLIPNVLIVHGTVAQLQCALQNTTIVRQDYPACNHWGESTDSRTWLYPQPQNAFRSFSQYWKQVKKHSV